MKRSGTDNVYWDILIEATTDRVNSWWCFPDRKDIVQDWLWFLPIRSQVWKQCSMSMTGVENRRSQSQVCELYSGARLQSRNRQVLPGDKTRRATYSWVRILRQIMHRWGSAIRCLFQSFAASCAVESEIYIKIFDQKGLNLRDGQDGYLVRTAVNAWWAARYVTTNLNSIWSKV